MPDDYGMSYGEAFGSAVRSAKKARKQRRKAAAAKKKGVKSATTTAPKMTSKPKHPSHAPSMTKPFGSRPAVRKVAGKAVPSRSSAIRKSDASGYAKRTAYATKRKER